MHFNFRYKPGMRSVKTVLAVGVCLLASLVLPGRERGMFSSIAAIICMQPTAEASFRLGVHRVVGTAIGGVFGFLTLLAYAYVPQYYRWTTWLVLPIAMLAVIYICNVIQEAQSSAIGCIVVLAIAYNTSIDPDLAFTVAYQRVMDTLIGIAVALLINRFVFPPKKTASEPESEQNLPSENPSMEGEIPHGKKT